MTPILVLVLLGLSCQNSLANLHTRMDLGVWNDDLEFYSTVDTVLSKLEAVENHEAEQTVISSKLLSSFENILDERLLENLEEIALKYHIEKDEPLDWYVECR